MIPLSITPNLEKSPWEGVITKVDYLLDVTRIGRLPNGTRDGNSTVSILMQDPRTGEMVCGQTTLKLFNAAHLVMRGSAAEEGEMLPGIIPHVDESTSRFQFEVHMREIGLEPLLELDVEDPLQYKAMSMNTLWQCWKRARQQP